MCGIYKIDSDLNPNLVPHHKFNSFKGYICF